MLQTIECFHDGIALKGQLAVPNAPGPHPGVLVMANAYGIGAQTRKQAQLLAAHGYVAIATDMYGDGVRCASREETARHITPLVSDPARLRARVHAWYDALQRQTEIDPQKLAAIGYCFGGQCALDLARSGADIKAAVSFHGLLETTLPAPAGGIGAHIAVYTGALDPFVPPAHVQAFQDEMIAAKADYHLTIFGKALHAFTDPDLDAFAPAGLAYDEAAARMSWCGTMALLDMRLA